MCLIGYGGIGSAVGMFLAKMGVREFTVYDHDDVQHHNLSNQMFPNDSIGKLKVEVAREELLRYAPYRDRVTVHIVPEKFGEGSSINGAQCVVSALDSIAARREVWEVVKWEMPDLYIDARMGGEVAKVYSLNPLDGAAVRFYEASLTQKEYDIPCTARAIAYNVGLIAAIVGSTVRKWVGEIPIDRLVIGDALNLSFVKL